jgi:hypothetical protein
MATEPKKSRPFQTLCAGVMMLASAAATGCQVDMGGQTLPSPYYLTDDVQYFPPGPEFKLTREAAAMKEQKAQQMGQAGSAGYCP